MINDNDRIDTHMNENSQSVGLIIWISLLNSHTLPPDNKSSKMDDTNNSVDNGGVNCDYCYINSSTVSVINNNILIYYKHKKINFIPTDI